MEEDVEGGDSPSIISILTLQIRLQDFIANGKNFVPANSPQSHIYRIFSNPIRTLFTLLEG